MKQIDKIDWSTIRRQMFEVLDGMASDAPLAIKAVPIAFPVVEATYDLRERVPERIGLVRRFILEGVCRFGPCSPSQLDAFLGLGVQLIENTLGDLLHYIPSLKRNGEDFSAGQEARRVLEGEEFTRVVSQRRKFVVNGLTDTLLPITFWQDHEDWRLFPDPSNPNGRFRTESGQPTEICINIVDRGGAGRDDLQRLIDTAKPDIKKTYGVPVGMCDRPGEPESIQAAWVLSFLLLREDGEIDVVSAHRKPVRLINELTGRKDYLRKVCHGIGSWILDRGAVLNPPAKWTEEWPEGTDMVPGRYAGELLVRVRDPENTLRYVDGGTDLDSFPGKRLSVAILRGRHWSQGSWGIFRLVPGDTPTAARVALLRGIQELRSIVRPLQPRAGSKPIEIGQWWEEWQRRFCALLPETVCLPIVPLAELLLVADTVRDTDFLDKIEWLAG